MKKEDIEKSKELIKDISQLNRMRQYEIAEDIDDILKGFPEELSEEEEDDDNSG